MCPALERRGFYDRDCTLKVIGGVRGLTLDADFAFGDEGIHGRCGFLEVIAEPAMVEVVNVDVVALQIDQALFTLMPNVCGFVCVFGGSWEVSDFCGDDNGFRLYA